MSTTPSPASVSPDHLGRDVAEALAAEVLRIRGVAALHAGRYGEVALLYPRHRVRGLRLHAGRLEVHLTVALDAGRPLADVAAEVRDVVARQLDLPVDIHFADATATGDLR